jgi:hypothetical protein
VLLPLLELIASIAVGLLIWYGGSYLILIGVRWLFPLVGRRTVVDGRARHQ